MRTCLVLFNFVLFLLFFVEFSTPRKLVELVLDLFRLFHWETIVVSGHEGDTTTRCQSIRPSTPLDELFRPKGTGQSSIFQKEVKKGVSGLSSD